jgi:uncharacterized HhH-GPD family protein
MTLCLAQDPDADALLSADPFALLAGMLLDQQFPMERAFAGPLLLARRMDPSGPPRLDPAAVAAADPEALTAWMTGPPAVHRYPGSMGGRLQAVAAHVLEHYDGDTTRIWRDQAPDGGEPTGQLVRARLEALPGFGRQKASIFVALLGKQLGVTPSGWREAAGAYGADGSFRSVADVRDAESLTKVRETKRLAKAAKKAAAGRP